MRLQTLLSLLLAGLLVSTAVVGWLSYSNSRQAIKHLKEEEFTLANGTAAHMVTDFLDDPADRLLQEYALRARRGMLSLNADRALAFDFAERLRVNPTLAWISYSDNKTGHFVGVWRDARGQVISNVSSPGQGPAHESIITPDGREIPYLRSGPKEYDPRLHDWFKNAMSSGTTVWSEPYLFADGVNGITASRAWRPVETAPPVGVFTVDFYLRDLRTLLDGLADNFQGFVVLLKPDGKLICSSSSPNARELTAALATRVRVDPNFTNINGRDSSRLIPMKLGSSAYLAALEQIHATSGLQCVVGSIVPQSVIYGSINRSAERTALIGLAALVLALLSGWVTAWRISQPLDDLGHDLAKVGEFHLAQANAPRSLVIEVNQLREAADRMKSGLRSFIKYVPDDLVRQLLASGKEAVLGGEIRRLTIFFSDIEGFAAHSEQVTPNVLVHELGRYFETLSDRMRQHGGTIDKFIGDGLLVFFNAPQVVPSHETQACRAAVIALEEIALRQKEGRMFPFRTRVGLHSGDVLVGNIGTPQRFNYTVLGDGVNVASRLETLNKIYGTQILASHDVREHAGPDLEWRHLDRVSVFGRKAAVDIYELIGLKDGVDEDRLFARKLYEEALQLYLAWSLWDARRLFGQVAERMPGDRAATLMMTRCDHMMSLEIPDDWDGVFVYTFK